MRLLIDTDTAADDAVALLLALRSPGVEVSALTIVAGNVPLEQATRNALATLDVAGRLDVPVHVGAAEPLLQPIAFATEVHGEDGLGDVHLPPVGEPSAVAALDATLELVRSHGPELTWVALGPLTNVATAVLADPVACGRVRELVIMGGVGDGVGNVTPAAEYNFWVDPEAARIVLRAGIPIRLVGWDVSRRPEALVTAEDRAALAAAGPLGAFSARITRRLWEFATSKHHRGGMDLPDPIAVAGTVVPELLTWAPRWVDVECRGELTRGASVVDHLAVTGHRPNVQLATAIDAAGFKALLLRRLSG
jgi:purine nucleosidase